MKPITKQQRQIRKYDKILMDNSEKQIALEPKVAQAAWCYSGRPGNLSYAMLRSRVLEMNTLIDEQIIFEGLLEDEKND